MKTLACDLCDYEAQGETYMDWPNALKPHYMDAHPDIISNLIKNKDIKEK